MKTLAYIKERGKLSGIVINPDTSIESIHEMLNLCDYVMVMTVNPEFAGQKFLDFTKKKIETFVELKEKYGFKITIDGACSPEIIKELSKMGCDGFILGTSDFFGKNKSYEELVKELRSL